MTKRMRFLVLVCLALAIPSGAKGQVSGRLRQRVQQALGGEKKDEPTGIDRSKVFTGDVIEITAAGMRGLHNGLDTEIRLLTEWAALLETYKPHEEYQRCEGGLAASPEGMAIMLPMANLPDSVSAEEMQRLIEKINKEMNALKREKCGPSIAEEWPQPKRTEKLQEIGRRAAAEAGPVTAPDPPSPGGPAAADDAPAVPRQQQGLSFQAYIIFKERVNAYCAFKKLKGASMPVTPGDGYNLSFEASALGGGTSKAMWIFTAQEVLEMDPECDKVTLKIGKIQMLVEMPPIYIKGGT